MRLVNERSGLEFEAWFEAQPDEPVIPSTVHWRLYDKTNVRVRQDWLETAPEIVNDPTTGALVGVRAVISVDGALNAIGNTENKREEFVLQVVADKDLAREFSETHEYYVMAMAGGRA